MAPCRRDQPAFLAVASSFPVLLLPGEVCVGPLEIASAGTPGGVLPAQAHSGCQGAEAHEVSSGEPVGSLRLPALFQVSLLECSLDA